MKEIISTVTAKGQVTIPAEVRRFLGVTTPDKVAFVIEGAEVRLKPAAFTVESVRGSIAPLPHTSPDFEREIAEAKEERAAERARRRHRP